MILFSSLPCIPFRIQTRIAARTVLVLLALIICSSLTACFTTDPTLDTSGELRTNDIIIGTGATISVDTNIVTQVDVVLSERLANGTITRATAATKLLVDNFTGTPTVGLDKGLRGMRVGSTRTITVPPWLGYLNHQQGSVPPNSTIIYDVTLNKTEVFLIEDLVVGTGDSAKYNSTVNVTYVGRLLNGNYFDATTAGATFSFRIGANAVIRGWDIGVLNMRVGGKRRLTIPSLLGYGATAKGTIPANSTLIFEIELVSIVQ
jgi:FKBP-type peptidyl-prolyl cis-trans isomerase